MNKPVRTVSARGEKSAARKRQESLSPLRSARNSATLKCAHCHLPLCIEIPSVERLGSSSSFCKECEEEKTMRPRTAAHSGRLVRSASTNWTSFVGKMENWFETAHTPDQQVVYNFLEKINQNNEKQSNGPAEEKSLNEILGNLKKFRKQNRSMPSATKLSRQFESSSWRVMRHPSTNYQFTRPDPVYPDEASRDAHIGTVFAPTNRRIGSTFLLHPSWI